jgi:hypothetical protein
MSVKIHLFISAQTERCGRVEIMWTREPNEVLCKPIFSNPDDSLIINEFSL